MRAKAAQVRFDVHTDCSRTDEDCLRSDAKVGQRDQFAGGKV